MISNSAKLDSRTKKHTQSEDSTSDGSRDMAATKSCQKKRKKKQKKQKNEAFWMVSYGAKLDSRTKQHTQFGVSASNGSRDMARTKVAEKKEKRKKRKKNEHVQNYIASPTGIANNNETCSRSPCMRLRSDPQSFDPIERGEKQTNIID